MTLKPKLVKFSAMLLAALTLAISSCQEDEPDRITLQDTADLTEEALTDAYFQDLDDMAGVAIATPSETEYANGRTSASITIEDHRFACEGIVITIEPDANSTAEIPSGVLTVDFGTSGCTDQKGNVRKGKVIFTYHGKRFMPGSTVITSTQDYSINDVQLEGVRTSTNAQSSTADAPRFNVTLDNGRATFANGLTATRESNITWQWNKGDAADLLDDNLIIESTSTASGITRGGRSYEVTLGEDLIYMRHCGIAVSGIKHYTIDGEKEISIDYGDGSCDQSFSVTVNGVTRDIALK